MAYDFDSTDEVRNILASFDELPEAYPEECRTAYVAIARNQVLQRFLKADIERIQTEYNGLVASGEIELAIESVNKLNALRNVLETATQQGNALTVPADVIREWMEHVKRTLGQRLSQLRSDAQAAEPPSLLFDFDASAMLRATDEQRQAYSEWREWNWRYGRCNGELDAWRSTPHVTNLIWYVQQGSNLVQGYADLVPDAKRVAELVKKANQQHAEKKGLTEYVEAAKKNIVPWAPRKSFQRGTCVNLGGHVYYTVQGGTSGMTRPSGAGIDGTIVWILLGPLGAFKAS